MQEIKHVANCVQLGEKANTYISNQPEGKKICDKVGNK